MSGIQWNKPGDHPGVTSYDRAHIVELNFKCSLCGKHYIENGQYTHGRIEAPEEYWNTDPADYIICPGDWIYQDSNGDYYPDNDRHLLDELREQGQITIKARSGLIHDILFNFKHVDIRYADPSLKYWLITLIKENK